MKSNLCKWWVEHSTVMQLVQMRTKLHKWGVEYSILYSAACVDDVKLVKMRGGTVQFCNLYKWGWNPEQCSLKFCYATCANEVEFVQMRDGKWYNIHLLYNLCRWTTRSISKPPPGTFDRSTLMVTSFPSVTLVGIWRETVASVGESSSQGIDTKNQIKDCRSVQSLVILW